MGGWGSGNQSRYGVKDTVERCLVLDVNWLNRKGFLQPGKFLALQWMRREQTCGRISGYVEQDHVILEYRYRILGDLWEDMSCLVPITWTPCNYGGQRPWFVCPGLGCNRRVGKLYCAGMYFRCRHCHDLVYESQREGSMDRLLRKARSIRRKLGGSGSVIEPIPEKPKGMHWKTYVEYCLAVIEVEETLRNMVSVWKTNMWSSMSKLIPSDFEDQG